MSTDTYTQEEQELEKQMQAEPEPVVETPAEPTPPAPVVPTPPPVIPPVQEQPKPTVTKEQEIISNLQRALKEARHEYNEKIDTFKNEFVEFKNKLTQPEVRPPDPNEDPIGAQNYKLQQIEKQQQELQQQLGKTNQLSERQILAYQVSALENSYRAQKPDYDKALIHLQNLRKAELEEFGITDPNQINAEINRSAQNLAEHALKIGRNPAEVVYNLATKYGYKSETPAAVVPQGKIEDAIKASEPIQHLDAVAQAQQKSGTTIPSGAEPDDKINYDRLYKAEGAEFDKLWNEYFKEDIKR